MQRKNKLYHSIAISVGSSYIFYAINFIGQLFLARLLLPEHFGIVALVLAILGMVDLLVAFSIPMAYIQEKETETLYDSAYFLSLIIGLLPVFIALILYYPLSSYYDSKIALFTLLISFSKPFNALGSIMIAQIEKNLKFGKSYLLRGIAISSSLGISVIMAYNGYEENSLVAREILGGVFLFIIAKIYFKKSVSLKYELNEIKSLMKYSVKMLFSRGAELAYFKIPFLIIGTYYGTTTLGLFSQAFYLVSLTSTALNPITEKVAFVYYSHAKNNNHHNKKDFNTITIISLVISIPISIILFSYSEEILRILYGEKWVGASDYLQYLSIFGLLLPVFNNFKSFFYSIGKNKYITISYLIALAVSLFLIYYEMIEFVFGLSLCISLILLVYLKMYIYRNNS